MTRMFDQEVVTLVKENGTEEHKRWVTEDMLQSEEMEIAQADFLQAEKKFRDINSHPDVVTDIGLNVRWWIAMEKLYVCEKRLWELFCGEDRSPRSTALYNQYRERLVRGKKLYRPNA